MRDLRQYLQKFQTIQAPDRTVRNTFIKVVERTCGITLKNYEVSVQRTTIFVTTNPVVKSEIILRRAAILRECRMELLGKDAIREIR